MPMAKKRGRTVFGVRMGLSQGINQYRGGRLSKRDEGKVGG